MAYLKKGAPDEVVKTLGRIEALADECWRPLLILEVPANLAVWALLTGAVQRVESERGAGHSINTSHVSVMQQNFGRLLVIAVKWSITHAQMSSARLTTDFTHELESAVGQAIAVAEAYSHFEVCFQAFHKNRYAADLLAPDLVRFTAPGGARDRQVRAYLQGRRPRVGSVAPHHAEELRQTAHVRQAFERVLADCLQTGARSFAYGEPWDLWRALLPECEYRVRGAARRADSLSLGDYRLDEFNSFHAALITLCAAHDLLCFRWGRMCRVFPVESSVMVRSVSGWIDLLSRLSGVAYEKCQAMVSDLTFSVTQSLDLHVHPFVALGGEGEMLALAPPFPLHSRHDENILRVCSQRRGQIYDVTSSAKEAEMRASLRDAAGRFGADGPISLPRPVSDIDLMMADEASATLVIAELKWIRKTLRPAEYPDRDADVLKGLDQLSAIMQFLAGAPGYLAAQGKLGRSVREYQHIYHLLVARDHWRWVEPQGGIAIVEFEAFAAVLRSSSRLDEAMNRLLTYEWLPVEGRDFDVRYHRATANGVSIESQVFYPRPGGRSATA